MLAQSTEQLHRTLDRLALVLLLVSIVGVGLAALAGLAVASAGLRPVERLTKAAEEVSRTGIPEPLDIPEGPPQDELARLATTFNAMLAALAVSRDQQRRLVADAGHELRTPLTSLRTNLDLLAQSDAAGAAGGGRWTPPTGRPSWTTSAPRSRSSATSWATSWSWRARTHRSPSPSRSTSPTSSTARSRGSGVGRPR